MAAANTAANKTGGQGEAVRLADATATAKQIIILNHGTRSVLIYLGAQALHSEVLDAGGVLRLSGDTAQLQVDGVCTEAPLALRVSVVTN